MKVTEFDGEDRVLFECDACGFRRWIINPNTMEMFKVKCRCKWIDDPDSSSGKKRIAPND